VDGRGAGSRAPGVAQRHDEVAAVRDPLRRAPQARLHELADEPQVQLRQALAVGPHGGVEGGVQFEQDVAGVRDPLAAGGPVVTQHRLVRGPEVGHELVVQHRQQARG